MLSAQSLQHGYIDSLEAMGLTAAKEAELSLAHRTDLWEGPRLAALHKARQMQACSTSVPSSGTACHRCMHAGRRCGSSCTRRRWRQASALAGQPGSPQAAQAGASRRREQGTEAQRQWMQVRDRGWRDSSIDHPTVAGRVMYVHHCCRIWRATGPWRTWQICPFQCASQSRRACSGLQSSRSPCCALPGISRATTATGVTTKGSS